MYFLSINFTRQSSIPEGPSWEGIETKSSQHHGGALGTAQGVIQ